LHAYDQCTTENLIRPRLPHRDGLPFEKRFAGSVASPFAKPLVALAFEASAAENSELSWPRSVRGMSCAGSRLGATGWGSAAAGDAAAAFLTGAPAMPRAGSVGGVSRVGRRAGTGFGSLG